ncbi:hypothetical protein KC887_00075 [Candidatus Kaiserbacteria bacterium]|nr:hypothetical protein [Candidatus Kaiserbacteria bacterium]
MTSWINRHTLIAAVVAAFVMYIFVTSIQKNRLYELELLTRAQVAEQETVLATIAEVTARNGADAVTESVIRDCTQTERSSFDSLLGRLDAGLSTTELSDLERLFGRCGRFYAERKSVMVARLEREIEVYASLIAQASVVAGRDQSEAFQLPAWQNLSELESRQSELFTELVNIQDEIISTLLTGGASQQETLANIKAAAKEVQENLALVNTQAAAVRAELLPL